MRRLVECVPNFSEGRDPAIVEQIAAAITSVAGARILDREMDRDHNRAVITFVAGPEAAVEAAVRAVGRAAELIDLNRHTGGHPRIGAADVVPFVPLEGMGMEECVDLARRAGEQIWQRFHVPVYFYEAAARTPERRALENIRRGQFEGLREEVKTDPARRPDVGGPELHPTAGATAVGARKFLIAYNIYLDTGEVAIAKRIARKIRASSGGLACVKAMGLLAGGRAQVSMNLTDFETTGLHTVFEAVRAEAAREGVTVASSEIVGLIPKRALEAAAAAFLRAEDFHPGLVLENRLAEELPSGLSEFLDRLSAPTPAPGGGSAAAAAAAMAAALGEMVAGLAAAKGRSEAAALGEQFRPAREFFEKAVERDAAAYEAVRRARRDRPELREAAVQEAAAVPLEVYERAGALADLVARLRAIAPPAMASDLDTAGFLLAAARAAARANVEINVADIRDENFLCRVRERLGR